MARPKKVQQPDNDALTNGPAADAVLAVNFHKFARGEDDLTAAKKEFKDVVKHVEAKGINVKAAAIATKILRKGSVATTAYTDLIRAVLAFLDVAGSPVPKEQIDLFAGEEPRTPIEDRARKAGRSAAFFDKGTGDNPYDPTSDLGQEWLNGLAEGRVEVDLILALEPAEGSELIPKAEDPFDVKTPDFIDPAGEEAQPIAAE